MPENLPDLNALLLKNNLSTLLNQIRLFIIGIDINGVITYVNPYFVSKTAYKYEELIGKSIYEKIVPASKTETYAKSIHAVIENKYPMQTESQMAKKDGGMLFVEWNNFPLTDGKDIVGVISIGIDITSQVEMVRLLSLNEQTMRQRADISERQNVELAKLQKELQEEKRSVEKKVELRTKELNEEKARLLASINSFPYGLLVTDTQDNVVIANDRLGSIFEVKKVEWNINNLRDFLSGSVNFLKYYGLVKSTKEPQYIKDIDLERKFLNIYIAPIFLNPLTNDIIGNLILVTDVTEQKIVERSKDEFFSIASHELRTPLTAIRGNAELIKKYYENRIRDNLFTQMVDDIESSSIRLISLVNEFLNMSRLEQGKMQFKVEEFNVADLAHDVINELMSNAAEKGLYIRLEKKNDPIANVAADADRTREVLINLISNALAYTDRGGCTVQVFSEMRRVMVKVTDTGKGIPMQSQNLLFRKFQQANQNIYSRDASRSTGLGLYISKLMVEEMRGSIYLEKSEVGRGSTFVFTLPVA